MRRSGCTPAAQCRTQCRVLILSPPVDVLLMCRCVMSCSEEAKEGTMWADKEAAIRLRLSAGHFSTPAGLRGVVLAFVDARQLIFIRVTSRVITRFEVPRMIVHKGDSKLASTSSITPSTVMPSSIPPTALGSLPHCRLFSVLEVAKINL